MTRKVINQETAMRTQARDNTQRAEATTFYLVAVTLTVVAAFAARPALHELPLGSWFAIVGALTAAIVLVAWIVSRAIRR